MLEEDNTSFVSCSGSIASEYKHPIIYLKITDKTPIVCPYCSKTFVMNKGKGINNKFYIEAHEKVYDELLKK